MAELYIVLSLTMDTGEVKELTMNKESYSALRDEVRNARGRTFNTLVPIVDANGIPGEFFLPWGKVSFAEAFIAGEPSPEQVALMGFTNKLPEIIPPP